MRQLYMLDGPEIDFSLESPWERTEGARKHKCGALTFMDTSIGGSGSLERTAAEMHLVAKRAIEHLDHKDCETACYRCLKSYNNQRYHEYLAWPLVMPDLEHEFMPENVRPLAYYDRPVPIGLGQTISQPYIVALMTELAAVGRGSRVLEIGTGSGYQAAVLAELGADVYSIEILAPLQERAVEILARLGYGQVKTRVGDGYMGWPEAAPFDAIIVTAAPARVPEPLKQQLKVGGRLVLPVGKVDQELEVITRTAVGFSERNVIPVRFVPMTGKADESR